MRQANSCAPRLIKLRVEWLLAANDSQSFHHELDALLKATLENDVQPALVLDATSPAIKTPRRLQNGWSLESRDELGGRASERVSERSGWRAAGRASSSSGGLLKGWRRR